MTTPRYGMHVCLEIEGRSIMMIVSEEAIKLGEQERRIRLAPKDEELVHQMLTTLCLFVVSTVLEGEEAPHD